MPISHLVEWQSFLSFPFSLHLETSVVQTFSTRSSSSYPLPWTSTITGHSNSAKKKSLRISSSQFLVSSSKHLLLAVRSSLNSYSDGGESSTVFDDDDVDEDDESTDPEELRDEDEGFEAEIEKTGNNRRRIRSKIAVEADLQTLWSVLSDYERLADFIPGLAVSRLLLKRENFARLLQIGEQNLIFGLKFNAGGVVDCYEKELESLPFSQRRDIDFKMIEGDFQLFEGKWSIEQLNSGGLQKVDSLVGQEFNTTLSYVVDVEPKLWLPVGLVEGRICREIKMNLSCIREEAQKAYNKLRPGY